MELIWCLAAAFLLFLPGLSTGQRMVTVQKGPLYRVRGSHITLWCNVSGYQGPAEQNFQWSIYLPSAPEREVQIVSTVDDSFPYAIYTQRVRSRGIYVERVQGDTVLLHITELQDRDAGEYECHTPNTDERYFGSYSAKMNLSVIADTLSASMAPQVLTHAEGEAMELTCEVSKTTAQHTHLSVGWYRLQEAGESHAEEILTLSKDFVLRPGPSYMQRFLVGDVRLNKVGSTTYKLSIGGVKPSDQGQLYCEAAEWIEDPDGTWKDVSRKQTGRTSLKVISQERRLRLSMSTNTSQVTMGDALIFLCEVQGATSRVSVRWWHLPPQHPGPRMLVATMAQDGTLRLGNGYQDGRTRGSLRLEKMSSGAFTLVIPNTLDEDDGGQYGCEVTEWSEGQSWTAVGKTAVTVSSMGLGLHAILRSRIATIRYGQSFELICQVSASYTFAEVPMSVRWLFQPSPPTGHYHNLVWVFPNCTTVWGTAQPHFQGKTQLTKTATSFSLHIYNAVAADEGTYQCEVEVWRRNAPPLGQPAATTRSNAVGIKVVLPESKLQVATEGSSVEIAGHADTTIECRIVFALNNSQFAVTWYFQPPPPSDATPLQIIRTDYSSILEYGAEFSSSAQKSRFLSQRVSRNVFWLQILSVNPRDRGRYYCVIEEWLWLADGWYKLGEGASGSTMLEFKLPERELQLDKTNYSISVREGEEVTLSCLLQGVRPPTTYLSATWFWGKESSHVSPLLILHRDGAIKYPRESLVGRLHLRRPTTGNFSLTLLSVEKEDAGVYCCQVQEWQQQSEGKVWALQALAHSGYTQLTTIPQESTVMSRICSSPPLLNFVLYLPLVLILLLILAVFCWYFKFRKNKKENIAGNKPMELQGDGEINNS